ncbi:hypothetical protein A359_07650 [secondary endosymbiont of Ctenarytaina eucalypti]|uniref:Uncharacterized protein n=1 Tax=secondary endosymbiont of Ctenarytaina eucalypti TaxID=1199245 RepID=J3Z4B8_9ENTR|nr:hypothetical protein A359_07650 [secondary endosymbiont of Ctenarytaina eucalypti]
MSPDSDYEIRGVMEESSRVLRFSSNQSYFYLIWMQYIVSYGVICISVLIILTTHFNHLNHLHVGLDNYLGLIYIKI